MIKLTRLNDTPVVINCFLIEHLEATPDTVVSLTTGRRFVVRETVDEVVELAVAYLTGLHEREIDPVIIGQLGRVT
jgi:flagellar protein FlbD